VDEQHSIAEARSSLPDLVRKAEAGKAVELTRRGEPVAVLIGRKRYERLVSGSRHFSAAWEEFAREVEVAALDIDPDEVFSEVRDQAAGRDTKL
jgi:prevent-host-death family protein